MTKYDMVHENEMEIIEDAEMAAGFPRDLRNSLIYCAVSLLLATLLYLL